MININFTFVHWIGCVHRFVTVCGRGNDIQRGAYICVIWFDSIVSIILCKNDIAEGLKCQAFRETSGCPLCEKLFTTERGRSLHLNSCRRKAGIEW